MKAHRSLTLLATLCVGLLLGGCRSTWDFWKDNAAGVVKSQRRNAHHIHRSLDRHFLNYDWDDPYLDE
ncbi:MAG: hypothetical protein JNJ88_18700 [Planctomycetes bacterium]|nr:hypothetical protein [Planctomycetota bacterium]